jgi:hypothetical protein
MKFEYADGDYEKGEFPVQVSFAMQIGAGIMINNLFSIGLHYYGLGAAKIKYVYKSSYGYYDYEGGYGGGFWDYYYSPSKKYSQSCVMLRLGLHF